MYTNSIREGKVHKVNGGPFIDDNVIQMLLQELADIEYERYKELKMKLEDKSRQGRQVTKCFNINLLYNLHKVA